ncbi:carbohydrate kinase [Ornithinibacillus xuwenensis]|uniref:Carbohydrate kinase n=1 Tax=Ornithinibacillus xuwenensis TaxID=3144668 RepID=A0ABU9XFR4_9BACI
MNNALNENEKRIFELIKKNPFVSQQELANEMDLSRPSIANLISGLVKKGYIHGKAYVVNESNQIICIGGANVDRKFYVKGELQFGTSNPIRSTQSAGGVARNVAENLGRLGMDISLITASGLDAEWSFIEVASSTYMDLNHVIPMPKASTGSYSAVINDTGELILALADMDIYDAITPELLQTRLTGFPQPRCIIADLNLASDALFYLQQFANQRKIPLVFIAVSAPKMSRLPDNLDGLTWLIANREESEAYFNIQMKTEKEWENGLQKWLDLGVQNVVVTNGKEGSMIGNKEEGIHFMPALAIQDIQDVTGAGDAFTAAVIHTWLEGRGLKEIAKAGAVNAAKTVQTKYTVRQNLSSLQLQKDMEEI